ncbi:MAG: nucleoside phosphorylase [Candidatus Asgardarchaeia archaeon]
MVKPHIACDLGDLAENVVITGDPKRVDIFAKMLDEGKKIAENRQYIVYTGRYKEIEVSILSTGIGTPATAIALEEAFDLGVSRIIRVGTIGALKPGITIGDLIIPFASVRDDHTTENYAPSEYPAVASPNLFFSLEKNAKARRKRFFTGIIWTSDIFYLKEDWLIDYWRERNVIGVEMETALLFVFGHVNNIEVGAILVVDGNLVEGTGKGQKEEEIPSDKKEKVLASLKEAFLISLETFRDVSK